MKRKTVLLSLIVFLTVGFKSYAQYSKTDSSYKECFVGSTFFMLGNFAPTNKPDFVQLNLGYRISEKDVVSLEVKTWKYAWSLGIPYGSSFEAPEEKFPGFIREKGFALVYQRYLWKGLYAGVHVMNAWQNYHNEQGEKFDKGFQIFNTYRIGYHVKLFKNKCFIEPSLAITHRPFQTQMPMEFEELNNKWSRFFFGEPGLHFGFNF